MAHAGYVDNFETGAYNSGLISSGSVEGWTPAAGALGGSRYTKVKITSNPLAGDAKTRVLTTPNILEFSSDSELDAEFTLGYGFSSGSSVPTSAPLNLNFGTEQTFRINFRSNDQLMPVKVTLFTNDGADSFSGTLNIPGGITTAAPQFYDWNFTWYGLADLDAITFDFDPAEGGDFSLNSIEAVPEPASMAAIAVGIAALIRRKKK
ncbi:MAG TPA: PEP-CTERM sorting domain-containing protein [Fimbriimonas sp.]|nr:PEP-CTERM sorting domain-containing protein [Fimbriimonas sp.]